MGNYVKETYLRSWDNRLKMPLQVLIYEDGSGHLMTPGLTITLSGSYDVRMLQKALSRAKERGIVLDKRKK